MFYPPQIILVWWAEWHILADRILWSLFHRGSKSAAIPCTAGKRKGVGLLKLVGLIKSVQILGNLMTALLMVDLPSSCMVAAKVGSLWVLMMLEEALSHSLYAREQKIIWHRELLLPCSTLSHSCLWKLWIPNPVGLSCSRKGKSMS